MWTELRRSNVSITDDQFRTSVTIWRKNVHVVNRRVCSTVEIDKGRYLGSKDQLLEFYVKSEGATKEPPSLISLDLLRSIVQQHSEESNHDIEFFLRKVLPRNSDLFQENIELVLLDFILREATFVNISQPSSRDILPSTPYCIALQSGYLVLKVFSHQSTSDQNKLWLSTQLLPRVEKWAVSAKPASDKAEDETSRQSLSLISIDKYNSLYQHLKKKYGQEMVRIWPECTDPAKFVYEDVAISAYLLLLWEEEKLERCSFVDLGCGNGLLVHILNSEGHQGIGLDVRERKVWSVYPSTTKLKVETILPSESTIYPDADWLIGNHSDELTPWIPVMAARSSQKTRFFVLPCCAYEFDGRKFNRPNASMSQYNSYLQYVQTISEGCGFHTVVDRLRIPSTKRVCLIGRERTYTEADLPEIDVKIKEIIRQGCLNGTNDLSDRQWIANFTPREKVERVRNCTRVDRGLQDAIVDQVVSTLLTTSRTIDSQRLPSSKWNAGGSLTLGQVASLVSQEQLKRLKKECGGLQTLLRNHHQIFKVEAGKVELRVPQVKNISLSGNKKARIGTKPCWFHANHPDGCFLADGVCSFAHELLPISK